jgi:hypothetical protein
MTKADALRRWAEASTDEELRQGQREATDRTKIKRYGNLFERALLWFKAILSF